MSSTSKMSSTNDLELQERNPLNIGDVERIFREVDTDGDGSISTKELSEFLKKDNSDLPEYLISYIHRTGDVDGDGKLSLAEFQAMINNPQLRKYFGRCLDYYMRVLVPRSLRDYRNVDYASQYRWYPPPIGMIIISVVIILFHLMDAIMGYDTSHVQGPVARMFFFTPFHRIECWRYLTYMFVHAGAAHLVVNVVVQICLALPLEMVHRWWRILIIYISGVVCGSILHSLAHPTIILVGASGGTYAVITAHLATLFLNWSEMRYRAIHLGMLLILIGSDIGSAIYENYYLGVTTNVGYVAHIGGGLSGFLIGINVMRNLRQTRLEVIVWWISIVAYFAINTIGVLLNIFWKQHFPDTHMAH